MSVQRVLNRISGYFQHFANADIAPYSDSERYTRLDPVDWSGITYFKDRDYHPQSIQLLASYSLQTKFNNGLFDIQLVLRGDALASALGPKNIQSIAGLNDIEENIPGLQNLPRSRALEILRRFDAGEALQTLAGQAEPNSILDEINYGEATYGSYTRPSSHDDTERRRFYDGYAAHIKKWNFADRYLSNPYQDWYYNRDRHSKSPIPT